MYMRSYETDHYIFHYNAGTRAEHDILKIAAQQEACFVYICSVLQAHPDFKIEYFLCDSPEEVGHIYGDDEPCNGFAAPPDRIYAVYNEKVQCIGFHEDAHIISYTLNRPDCPAIREGLAMYFDRKWWSIQNMDWVSCYLKTDRYISVDKLMDKEFFFGIDCTVSYPIMGAFTDYLIAAYGREAYLDLYRRQDMRKAMKEVYGKSPEELDRDFTNYVRLFKTDPEIEKRIARLLDHE